MALSSKFQGIALSVLAKLVNGGDLASEATMTITVNGKSQSFTIKPSATDGAPATTEADKAILARIGSYFSRKGTANAKGERNTIELEMVCELCQVEADAVRTAVRSSESPYRFFRGESIGVETVSEATPPAPPVKASAPVQNAPKSNRKVA